MLILIRGPLSRISIASRSLQQARLLSEAIIFPSRKHSGRCCHITIQVLVSEVLINTKRNECIIRHYPLDLSFTWRPLNKMTELGLCEEHQHMKLCIVMEGEMQMPRTLKLHQAKCFFLRGNVHKQLISAREGAYHFTNATLFAQQSVCRGGKPGIVRIDNQSRGTNPLGISTVDAEHSVRVEGDRLVVLTILHCLRVDVGARDDGLYQVGGMGGFA